MAGRCARPWRARGWISWPVVRRQRVVSFILKGIGYDRRDMVTVSPDLFKQVMRRWASTVNVVTTRHEGVVHGLTVTAFSSLAAEPPLVFVSVNKRARTHAMIDQAGIYAVNFLAPQQRALSDRFAGRMPEADRFAGVAFGQGVTGSPIFADAIAWLDCRVTERVSGGDHTLFFGQVVAAGTRGADLSPLLYFNGRYHGLGSVCED